MNKNRKAGPVTLAVGLILIGFMLLVANIQGYGVLEVTLKFWPIILIGLGAEYFVRAYLNKNNDNNEGTKFHLPTLVIILLVTITGFMGQQVAGLFKNHELSNFITEAIAGDRYSYRSEYQSKVIDVKPGITSIILDGIEGKVDLVPSVDGKFHVQAGITGWGPSEIEAKRRAEMVRIDIKEGDVINVYGHQGARGNTRRPVEVAYRFMIPKGVNIHIESENGHNIKADNLEANLKIKAQFAKVSIRSIKGNVSYEGENGQATFESIDGNLETRLGSGKMFIKDVTKDFYANSDNCDMEIFSSKPVTAKYSINNLNGFIVLKLPETSDASLTAKTTIGKIRGSLNVKHETGEPGQGVTASVVLGSGKGAIDLTTESGNIVMDKY